MLEKSLIFFCSQEIKFVPVPTYYFCLFKTAIKYVKYLSLIHMIILLAFFSFVPVDYKFIFNHIYSLQKILIKFWIRNLWTDKEFNKSYEILFKFILLENIAKVRVNLFLWDWVFLIVLKGLDQRNMTRHEPHQHPPLTPKKAYEDYKDQLIFNTV